MTQEEKVQSVRDYFTDIALDMSGTVALADEGDWEEALEYATAARVKANLLEDLCFAASKEKRS
jgi:predicted RNA-binding protein associated with RNAse of E/G family